MDETRAEYWTATYLDHRDGKTKEISVPGTSRMDAARNAVELLAGMTGASEDTFAVLSAAVADTEAILAAIDNDADEPCEHDCGEDGCWEYGDGYCHHQHICHCGRCRCAGYCDDYQTYNLRPAETGGAADA